MNILYNFTKKHLLKNKKRTLSTIIGIIISSALVCGTAILGFSFQDMFIREAIENNGNYHAVFYNVPLDKVKYISENSHVEKSLLSSNIGFAKVKSQNDYKPYIYLKAYDEESMENQPVHLTKGTFPQQSDEILISQHMIDDGKVDVDVGEEMTLNIGNRVLEGNEVVSSDPFHEGEDISEVFNSTFKVTGIIERPSFEAYESPGYTAITYLDRNEFGSDDVINVSILVDKPGEIFDVAPSIAEKAGLPKITLESGEKGYDISYNMDLLRYMGITNDNQLWLSIYIILAVVLLLIAVGSVTVIYNSFTISVSERKKQFGMLNSIGATPLQIRKSVIYEALIVALLGIPIGILSGIIGIKITLLYANNLLYQLTNGRHQLQMALSPWIIVITVLFTGLIIYISAYLPARRASRISPVQAMGANDDLNSNNINLKTGKLTKSLFGVEGEIALKALKRNKRKYRTTIFSLFISIVMFISFNGFMMYAMQGGATTVPEYDLNLYDVDYSNNTEREVLDRLSEMPEIEDISILRNIGSLVHTSGDIINKEALQSISQELKFDEQQDSDQYSVSVAIVALGNQEFSKYLKDLNIQQDLYDNADDYQGILINNYTHYNEVDGKTTEDNYNVFEIRKGDSLQLSKEKMTENEISESVAIEVGHITTVKPFAVWAYRPVMIVSDDVFDEISKDFNQEPYTSVYIKGEDVSKIEDRIIKDYKEAGLSLPEYYNVYEGEQSDRMMIQLFSLFFYGFISLITLIGITNIFNTIATNIQLRNREFALLQSVGLTPKGLNKILMLESALYGIKALSYGIPFSMLISYILFGAVNNGIQEPLPFSFPWTAIAICVVGVFIIVFTTMMYASSKTKRESIIDVIRNENI
ncbi:MAG: ABC transporter permease [Eubacteriales bacterium]